MVGVLSLVPGVSSMLSVHLSLCPTSCRSRSALAYADTISVSSRLISWTVPHGALFTSSRRVIVVVILSRTGLRLCDAFLMTTGNEDAALVERLHVLLSG
jgi:hypothetical protein